MLAVTACMMNTFRPGDKYDGSEALEKETVGEST